MTVCRRDAEMVIYAATSAGVCAAVCAAETGAQVILVEPGQHVGGMTSGGLGYTDVGDTRVLGGMAARLRLDVAEHYGTGIFAGPEPHVAEAVYRRWLEQAGVEVRLGEPLVAVELTGNTITTLTTKTSVISAGVFVDASYEGDLLAAAGVPYAVGREGVERYGERFAGRQELLPGRHTMPPGISPFANDPSGETCGPLLEQVKAQPLAAVGAGDGGVMSYGYRLCLTTAEDRVRVERRDGYQESYWELGRRLFRHWETQGHAPAAAQLIGLEPNLPNGKCDANSLGPFSLSVLDGSAWEYPQASSARREEIRLHHLHHAYDLLWFLTSDPTVPPSIRAEMARWGLPRDEFTDTGHLPHQLYVREARRMVGSHVVTEDDLLQPRPQPDAVAMGSYHIDIREVQRCWRWVHEHPRPIGMVFTEGYLSVPVSPYQIPYQALVPRPENCSNLLVSIGISASHVANASLRMEAQYQMLGHAAGLAAVSALRESCPVQQIDIPRLQSRLVNAGQVLAL